MFCEAVYIESFSVTTMFHLDSETWRMIIFFMWFCFSGKIDLAIGR